MTSQYIQRQKRNELIMQKKLASMRANPAMSRTGKSASGKYIVGSILLMGYLSNSAQINDLIQLFF